MLDRPLYGMVDLRQCRSKQGMAREVQGRQVTDMIELDKTVLLVG